MNKAFDDFFKCFNEIIKNDIKKDWTKFPLNEIEIHRNNIKAVAGIYALTDSKDRILYIGKAKSIYGRLNSHYKATLGKEKAEAWKQFFERFNSGLIAYYYVINFIPEIEAEIVRKIIERTLQLKYTPLFDQIYYKDHKKVKNLENRIKKYYYS